ncbi:hypothetical protein JTB14_000232 [Gonioctena quinquepunctata]|nr:hypothetical protein JTB14_000232 [Gonioctena quinquepunctata]
MTNRGPINLFSVYNPPSNDLANDSLEIIIAESDTPTIAACDFNAKHTTWSNVSNRNGSKLKRRCDNSNHLIKAPNEPTFYGPHRPDILEIVLIKNLFWDIEVDTLQELNSDHNPIRIELGDNPPTQVNSTYKITNWVRFLSENTAPRKISSLQLNSTLLFQGLKIPFSMH